MGITQNRTSGRRRVALQRRDLAIMEDLVLLRAETLDELHARHFPGLSRKRAVNRLAELANAGYLQRADVVLFGEQTTTRTYTLGPTARTALERRTLSSEHFRFRRWNPTLRDASIPHQIITNRILDQIGGTSVPEHLLPVPDRNGAHHRPDAVVEGVDVDGARGLLGIEIDLGHYSRERIKGKIDAWRAQPDRGRLLIIAPDDRRAQQLRGWIEYHHLATVLTFEHLEHELQFARSPTGGGVFFDLDIWTGGDALAAEREHRQEERRRYEQEERERYPRIQRERQAANEQAQREQQERRAAAAKKRRRFGV